jgi:hypothetical protein
MMSYRAHSGHWINLTPDKLVAAYNDLTPLRPLKVSLWGLNLMTQFFDALSPDLQDSLQTDPLYSSPNLSTLTSCSSKLDALWSLCIAAVRNHTILKNQERLIAKTVLLVASTPAAAPVTSIPSRPPRDGLATVVVGRLINYG